MARQGRKLIQAGIVVASLAVAAAAAPAAVNFGPAERLCKSQGGDFDAFGDYYRCVFLDSTPTLSERRAARRLCEGRYMAEFTYAPAAEYTDAGYLCELD